MNIDCSVVSGSGCAAPPLSGHCCRIIFLVLGRDTAGGAHAGPGLCPGLTAAGGQAVQLLPCLVTAAEFPTHCQPSAYYEAKTKDYYLYFSEHYYAMKCEYPKTVFKSLVFIHLYT